MSENNLCWPFAGRGHGEAVTTGSPMRWTQAIKGALALPVLGMHVPPTVPALGATSKM